MLEKDKQVKNEVYLRNLLRYIGEDPNRPGLEGTPDRIIRMWREIFRGYDPAQHPKITTFENGIDGLVYDNMITDTGCFYSMCEHHMMPFFGKYVFAYIPHPKGKILGLSKIGRVVDYHAAKLQIQERLVSDIVNDIASLHYDKPYIAFGRDILNGRADEGFALHWLPESSSYEYLWGDYALHFDGKVVTSAYAFRTDSTFSHNVLGTMPPATRNRMERHMKSFIQQYMQRMTTDRLVIGK